MRLRSAAPLLILAVALPLQGARAERLAIPENSESEILALLSPYTPGDEVVAGWRLWDVAIGTSRIELSVRGPGEEDVGFTLVHPDQARAGTEHTGSFAVVRTPGAASGPAAPAVDRLVEVIGSHDDGGFWGEVAREVDERPASRSGGLAALALDGTLSLVVLTALLTTLALRRRGDEPAWIRLAALPAVVLAGALLRLWLSPEGALGVWPYARLHPLGLAVFQGPTMAGLSTLREAPISLTEVMTGTGLVTAILAPLVVFVHGRYLLGRDRDGLAAAVLLAFLPLHLRFSHSEVAFVPSLVVSATAFVLTHVALRDAHRGWRVAALLLLPAVLAGMVAMRPLNVLFVPLLVAVPWVVGREVPRRRAVLVAVVVALAGGGAAAVHLATAYAGDVAEMLRPQVLLSAARMVFSPRQNTLLYPGITPPLVTLLAVVGGIVLWRRDRRAAGLLVLWLVGFLYFHATVTPQEIMMQCRYHLHLVVPFVLLAASATGLLLRWHPAALVVAGVVVVASPLIHRPFIQDVDFNELHEYAFVHAQRDAIPDGCTVLEFAGYEPGTPVPRFAHLGRQLRGGREAWRFEGLELGAEGWAPGSAADPLHPAARAAIDRPPACLVLYTGLVCYSHKEPGEPMAPPCRTALDELALEPIGVESRRSRLLDHELSHGFGPEMTELTYGLYRVVEE